MSHPELSHHLSVSECWRFCTSPRRKPEPVKLEQALASCIMTLKGVAPKHVQTCPMQHQPHLLQIGELGEAGAQTDSHLLDPS